MSAAELLAELKSRSIEVEPLPNGNLYVSPSAKLTDEDRAAIRAHKPELCAYFRARAVARWCEAN